MDPFTALSDPNRRRMLEMLAGREMTAGAIGAAFRITAPAVSQHLKALREAGLVRVRREAQWRIYSLNPDTLEAIEDWAARLRGFWKARLDNLENELSKTEQDDG